MSHGRVALLIAAGMAVLPGAGYGAGPARATATFAMGCFWCAETAFEGLPGVLAVVSGYTGGQKKNPSYEEVSSGRTGHAEAVQVVYDPARVSYEQLLEVFWHNIDPLQANGQFCDHGSQYRSAVFYADEAQRQAASTSLHEVEQRFKGTIATQLVPASIFYPAEEYHQDFYKKSPIRYRSYRIGCGRDRRLEQLWGESAPGHDAAFR